jgi:hypothetical protein
MENLLSKNKILKERGAACSGPERVLIVRYTYTLVRGEMAFARMKTRLWNTLMRFAAFAHLRIEIVALRHIRLAYTFLAVRLIGGQV